MGAWTPTVLGSTTAGSPTYTTQAGRYYRIGKLCFVEGYVKLSAKNDISGGILIGGLPFSIIAGEPRASASIGSVANIAYGTNKQLFAVFTPGTAYITLYLSSENSGVVLLNVPAVADSFEIRISGVYRLP